MAAILGIGNVDNFHVQLSQWSINEIGPALYGSALYGPMPTST
ncbi:hypothetical protein ACNF49_29555 [Actinomadura sp. ATCC 39365]